MQNPTSMRLPCPSPTRALEAHRPMNNNRTPIKLSAFFDDDGGNGSLRRVIEHLTSVDITLPLTTLLDPLGLPFDVIDPIMSDIGALHDDAVTAAFTAGLACGLNPEKLLLEGGAL